MNKYLSVRGSLCISYSLKPLLSSKEVKVIYLHADFVEWEPVSKALKSAEPVEMGRKRVDDCLVVMVAVEKGDNEDTVEKAVKDIEEHLERIKPKHVVLYPWVHLTQNPAPPGDALKLLKMLEQRLRNAVRAPFGWYKRFMISVKGHPLAELSRTF